MQMAELIAGVLLALIVTLAVVAVVSPRWRHRLPRLAGLSIGGVLAAYLVVRGIAEFFVVNYSSPASYRNDWGGPSLAGVFAVHSGPGLAVLAGAAACLVRRRRHRGNAASRGQVPGRSPVSAVHPARKQEV
jgi:hypothetical protein